MARLSGAGGRLILGGEVPMTATSWTGPAPDEFADFEAASRPRYARWSAAAGLRLAGKAAFLALVAALLAYALVWNHDNSPDRLVQGRWQTDEHPHLRELLIGPPGP